MPQEGAVPLLLHFRARSVIFVSSSISAGCHYSRPPLRSSGRSASQPNHRVRSSPMPTQEQNGKADLFIKNVQWLITVDPKRRIITDGAVAVERDRIVALGKTKDLE